MGLGSEPAGAECYFGTVSVDFLGGFRYLDLEEDLSYSDTISLVPTGPLNVGGLPLFIPPTSFYTFDRYHTRNQYYGAQIGADFEWYEGRRLSTARPSSRWATCIRSWR